MFLTVHGPAGALLGAMTGEPVSAFLLGVASHAVLDAIPHGDERLFRGLERHACIRAVSRVFFVDVGVLAIVLFFLLRPDHVWPSFAIIAGIAGGLIPDFASGLALLFPNIHILQRYYRVHAYFHEGMISYDPPLAVGFFIQAAFLAAIAVAFVRLT